MLKWIARKLALVCIASTALSTAATAQLLSGDLDGNGNVDVADQGYFVAPYGSQSGDFAYESAADLNGDGRINYRDLGVFGAHVGSTGGPVDTTPPSLFITLADIPGDMNDLLVAPPDAFPITLGFDSGGTGSVVDVSSLSVQSSQAVGALPAGSELGPLFSAGPTSASFEIPPGSDLAQTSHYLTVSIKDAAGNETVDVYGFAVRNFAFGPPLGSLNTVFLDFDQDRSLATEIDFIEDLRAFGLSSASTPALETAMRDRLVDEIVARTHARFDREPDGTPGADAVNVVFESTQPAGDHARLCVGGLSSLGNSFFGATVLDVENLNPIEDTCAPTPQHGVFPRAMDWLWGSQQPFLDAFSPIDPDRGGLPVGTGPLDAGILDPGFDPASASAEEVARWADIENAVDAFAQAVGSVVAHEMGHLLGLVAHGDAPAGLFGGESGANMDHNVTAQGGTPIPNHLMNGGGSFTFEEMTGRGGFAIPAFRALNWAYLHNRIAINNQVTGLFDPPTLLQVTPNPVAYTQGQTVQVTFHGSDFLDAPLIDLVTEGDPTPNPVLNVVWVDDETVTGTLNKFIVPAGFVYDVHLLNPDGQETVLIDGLEVQ